MGIYITFLFILVVESLASIRLKGDRRLSKFCMLGALVSLILLAGLRYNNGVDYPNYKDIYEDPYELHAMKELGFVQLVEFMNSLDLPYQVFVFLFSWLTVWLAIKFIRRYSPYPFLSLLIYFSIGNYYFSTFNAIRQGLAIVVFLNMIEVVGQRKMIKYSVVMILTALCVHFSAFLLIPLIYFLNRHINLWTKIILVIGISSLTGVIILLIENSPYAVYLLFDGFAAPLTPTNYMLLLFSVGVIYYESKNRAWSDQHRIFSNLNIIVLALSALALAFENTPMIMVVNRVIGYFSMIYIVVIPIIIFHLKSKSLQSISINVLSLIFAFLCYWALSSNGVTNMMVPYKTIFQS